MTAAEITLLAKLCAASIDPATTLAVVATESSYNPYAIGIVGGELERQPRSRAEALATIQVLERDGWNYSVGLGQINRKNFARLGLTPSTAIDPCQNLRALQIILEECFVRARVDRPQPQRALRAAFSCYYSGNFKTGFQHGYVDTVVENARRQNQQTSPKGGAH